jgi:hypothetical protein
MRSDRERRQQPSLTVTRHQDGHTSMNVSTALGMSGSTAWLWRGIDVTDVHTEQPSFLVDICVFDGRHEP